MARQLRPRLTYANVISTLCLFILLGGGAYAAVSLPKDSVGTKQLKNAAVTAPKLANKAVTGRKVKDNSLTGTDINVSTLGTVRNAAKLGGKGPAASAPSNELFRSGLVTLDPGSTVGNSVQRNLINDGPLSVVGVSAVASPSLWTGQVLIATTEDNTVFAKGGQNGNVPITSTTPTAMRTILEVGPSMSLGYVPGQLFGAVTPSGTALNGVVSAGTFLPNASNNPCFFNVDVFG